MEEKQKEKTVANYPYVHQPQDMTKRFYAACAAIQGILAGESSMAACRVASMKSDEEIDRCIAIAAFSIADALLEQEDEL